MPTTEEAPAGLVRPEFGPSAGALIRRHLSRRARVALALALALVAAAAAVLVARGDGFTQLEHRSAPVFTLIYPAGQVHRVAPRAGELVRLRAGRPGLRVVITARRHTLPPYRGGASGFLPIYADRQTGPLAAELPGFRARGDGKAPGKSLAGYVLRYSAGPPRRRVLGMDMYAVPADGRRDGVLVRYRQTNPPRPLGPAGRELVTTTRKVFRSFRFGLDRP